VFLKLSPAGFQTRQSGFEQRTIGGDIGHRFC
jgi:hypothetical protein